MAIVPMRSVVARILSSPVPMRMPYWSRILVTTAPGSMFFGVFTHDTVFEKIEASGNISSPIAATPRLTAAAVRQAFLEDQADGRAHRAGQMCRDRDGLPPRRAVGHLAAARDRDPLIFPAQQIVDQARRRTLAALHRRE